jgi:dCTP deaminase
MAFWSGETLEQELPYLIKPFDPKLIDCAAYTLRMGAEAYVSPSEAEQDSERITIRRLDNNQSFTIPAGQFAFLLTEEKISVPKGKLAFISMKSSVKNRGLVNVSGFHVDPGYNGNLIFAVFNAGPKTIHLRRGEQCFLIWFADLDNPASKKAKTEPGFTNITTELVTKISGEVMSFEGLNAKIKDLKDEQEKRLHDVEIKQEKLTTIGTIVLAVVVTALLAPSLRSVWDAMSTPAARHSKASAVVKPPPPVVSPAQ